MARKVRSLLVYWPITGNGCISSQRIVAEHAIGRMKRYEAISLMLRNKIGQLNAPAAWVSTGLGNHHLE